MFEGTEHLRYESAVLSRRLYGIPRLFDGEYYAVISGYESCIYKYKSILKPVS